MEIEARLADSRPDRAHNSMILPIYLGWFNWEGDLFTDGAIGRFNTEIGFVAGQSNQTAQTWITRPDCG
jgi:hypothetical protein